MTGGAIPKHIGIIMDGNGRWAELQGLPRSEGHRKGVQRVKEVTEAAKAAGVRALSLYAFSMENWKRPESEVSVIMGLMESTLKGEFLNFMEEGIRFRIIGNRERLSPRVREIMEYTEEATAENDQIILQCAVSYGGRDEIIRAVKNAIRSGLKPEEMNEERLSSLMDTAGLPDPDLIIRTSGEKRLSNFLLWQSAYSELYFTDTLWPDFTKEELMKAIKEYQLRDRRFGSLSCGENTCI
ncbi:MAG: polyprenyl diphosphate synthase [Thermodesulfovibrionales bacterium]